MYTTQAAGRKRGRLPYLIESDTGVVNEVMDTGVFDDELIKPFNTEEFRDSL
jgi:hypothetical protein